MSMTQNIYAIQGKFKDYNPNVRYIEYSYRTKKIYYNFINGARVSFGCLGAKDYFKLITNGGTYYKVISYKEAKRLKANI